MEPNATLTESINGTGEPVLKMPSWIDTDYFKDILVLDGKSKWNYVSHDVKMANEKGDNYASVLYRAKVFAKNEENQIEELSYILKVNPVLKGHTKELMDIFNVFVKEVEMYKSVVPSLQQLLENVGDRTKFSPKCLKTSTPEAEQIVLEDLSKAGFKMASRHDGLDMAHIKLVIERLSKFHAASTVFQENNGPYRDVLLQGMFDEKFKPIMETYFKSNLSMLKETVGTFVKGKRYLNHMENYLEKSLDKCFEVSKSNPNGFNVLNHGDLWTNNLMFQYDDANEVTNMLFLDLQMSVWGSPAIDLHYFIISSAQKNLKVQEFDTIVQYYHENLVKSLQELGYRKHLPTLLELQIDLLQRGFLAVMASINVLPVTLLEDCEDADINNMLNEGDAGMNLKRKLYLNPSYAKIMETLWDYFDKKGILQI